MPFDAGRFDEACCRYVTPLIEQHPAFVSYFAAGAAPEQLDACEAAIACNLPPDLRHLLSRHNGADAQVLPGWELFSAERIVEEWRVWEELYHDQFKPDGYDCEPTGPVRSDEWWRLKWIPFCGDGGGKPFMPRYGACGGRRCRTGHHHVARR